MLASDRGQVVAVGIATQVIVVGVAGQATILACPHRRRDGQIVIGSAHMPHGSARPVAHRLQRILAHRMAQCGIVGVADEQPRREVLPVIGAPGLPVSRSAARVTENRRDLVVT